MQYNIDGLDAHHSDISALIQLHNPHIICIQEYNKWYYDCNKKFFPNYNYSCQDKQITNNAKVAILIRNDINGTPLNIHKIHKQGLKQATYTRWHILNIKPTPIIICSYYKSPNVPIKTNISNINRDMKKIKKLYPNSQIIICGDMNARDSQWDPFFDTQDSESIRIHQFCKKWKLNIVNSRQPTRIKLKHKNINNIRTPYLEQSSPDLTLVSQNIYNKIKQWLPITDFPKTSDHLPILITVSKKPSTHNFYNEKFFNINHNTKWNKIKYNIKRQLVPIIDDLMQWYDDTIFPDEQSDIKYIEKINNIFIYLFIYFLKKNIKISDKKKKYKKWWNMNIDLMRKKEHKIYKKFKKAKKYYKRLNLMIQIKNIKKRIKKLIQKEKRQARIDRIKNLNIGDSKKCWENISKIINNGNSQNNDISTLYNKGKIEAESTEDKAEIFNTLYNPQNGTNLDTNNTHTNTKYNGNNKDNSEKTKRELHNMNIEFSLEEIKWTINTFEDKNITYGIDNIPLISIVNTFDEIGHIIVWLFNKFKSFNYIPNIYKRRVIHPIYKYGKPKENKKSYRPISITSTLIKIMEKAVAFRITRYTIETDRLNPYNFGFLKSKSTTDAILQFVNDILANFNNKNDTNAISFDFSSAFDNVNHEVLIRRLEKYFNIKGDILYLIKDFLQNRYSSTKINGYYSKWLKQLKGVPQGSPLSPILFILYISPIYEFFRNNKLLNILFFADDLLLYKIIKDFTKKDVDFQKAIDHINIWSYKNGLTLNPSKCNYVIFSKKKQDQITYYEYNSLNISTNNREPIPTQKSHIRYLGMLIDSKLTWTPHVKYILQKSRQLRHAIKTRIGYSQNINSSLFLYIYKATILPVYRYGSFLFYDKINKEHKDKLNSIHNSFIRQSTGALNSTPLINLYTITNELSLEYYMHLDKANFFSRFLRLNKYNLIFILLQKWIKIIKGLSNNTLNITKPSNLKEYKKEYIYIKNHPIYNAYLSADIINAKDINNLPFYKLKHRNIITPYYKMPPEIPTNLIFIPHLFQKMEYINWKSKYNFFIATDGSVNENGQGGYGIYIEYKNTTPDCIPFYQSSDTYSFSCELDAILWVIKDIHDKIPNNKHIQVLIITDSLNSINLLTHKEFTQDHAIYEMLTDILFYIGKKPNIQFFIQKVKAHSNILPNEKADEIAKNSLDPMLNPFIETKYPYKYATLKSIKKNNKKRTFETFHKLNYSQIKQRPEHDLFNKYNIKQAKNFLVEYQQFNIYKLQYITHLRTQHSFLNEYLYNKKLKKVNSPSCNNCSLNKHETTTHYLMECPLYKSDRKRLLRLIKHSHPHIKSKKNIDINHILFPEYPFDKSIKINLWTQLKNMYRINILNALYIFIIRTNRFKYLRHLYQIKNLNNPN